MIVRSLFGGRAGALIRIYHRPLFIFARSLQHLLPSTRFLPLLDIHVHSEPSTSESPLLFYASQEMLSLISARISLHKNKSVSECIAPFCPNGLPSELAFNSPFPKALARTYLIL